ncbi:MAG: NUDIX hydrolase [Pirellulales bacterium]|nr:NUDIX hydrolase [Pirellulales bacterium]
MPDKSWTLLSSRTVFEHFIFDLHCDLYRLAPDGHESEFVRLECADWVNVIPITAEGDVVFVRQYRHGVRALSLEIPGGMVDEGEPAGAAALRELQEETGYDSSQVRRLGDLWPNPAIQNNHCHLYVAENCRLVAPPRPDPRERIEVVTHPLAEIPRLIRDGEIRHSLVICAFALYGIVPATTE